MWDDNDNDNLPDDDDCDPEKEQRRVESLPIYQKAEEIAELTRRIVDSIDDEEVRMLHSNTMLEDSIALSAKIAGAEAVNDYIIRMENATLIKIHARRLQTRSASLIFAGVLPEEYLRLLRKEIDTFRLLFKQWVKSFDCCDKDGDGWGLFVDDETPEN
jgi:hypothetical protein